ncbi:MAG: MFS transporter [Desulfomonile tiedjei]|uniref:MFS transporter n=1 Tax=Desulfomonile tiedjei TaxID=2358 RepID=A0A9D6UZA8_9BACT|nr:MFS transporter [Desulfomonile tiedjei]
MESAERRILLMSSFGHFVCHYNMLVFPALVLPLAGALNMDMPQVLQLSFPQYLLFGVMALPWGLAGDRIGGKPLMLLMFLGSGLSGLAAALWIDSPWSLSVALGALGLFSSIYHPIGLGLISKGVSRLNLAMGYNAVFGGLGLVVAPLVSGLLNWLWDPRAAYLFLALVNLCGLVLMLLFPLSEATGKAEKKSAGNGALGAFVILLIAMTLGGLAFTGSTVILPAYLEMRSHGLMELVSRFTGGISGNLMATTITALVYMVGMIGQYTGGVVGERHDPRYAYLTFHFFCIPAAFLAAFASNLSLVGLSTIYFFCLLGMQPMENTLVALLAPKRLHHSAYGMKFIVTFGIGALAVKIVAWIDARWGSEAIFLALGLTSILLVSSILVLIRWTNHSETMRKNATVAAIVESSGGHSS